MKDGPKKTYPKQFRTSERFWASAKGAYLDRLELWCPETVRPRQYDAEGRYLLYCTGCDRRSVSWTRRGQVEAAKEALRTAWSMHEDVTGEKCPIPRGFVAEELAAAVPA